VKSTNYKGAQSANYKQEDVQKKHKVPSTNKKMFKRSTKCQVQIRRCSKEAQSAKYKQAVVHAIISIFCPQTPTINVITYRLGTWQREQPECRSNHATQVRNDFRSFIRQRLIWRRSKKLTGQRRTDSCTQKPAISALPNYAFLLSPYRGSNIRNYSVVMFDIYSVTQYICGVANWMEKDWTVRFLQYKQFKSLVIVRSNIQITGS